MVERIGRWVAKQAPTREQLAQQRWMRPFAHRILRSDLWRFTRRSVPRGVAVGIVVGIFLMIPGVQMVGAAFMSVPLRANIPIAAAMTFLSNPATTPFILASSILVGNRMGFHADLASFTALYRSGAGVGEWCAWLFSDAAPALVTGLFVISAVAALVGYIVSKIGWRWWQGRKWRRRQSRQGLAAQGIQPATGPRPAA